LSAFAPDARIGILATALPTKGTPNDAALRAVTGAQVRVLVDIGGSDAIELLRALS
jgi:hypothetical protein